MQLEKNTKLEEKVWKKGDRSVKRDDDDPPTCEKNLKRSIVG